MRIDDKADVIAEVVSRQIFTVSIAHQPDWTILHHALAVPKNTFGANQICLRVDREGAGKISCRQRAWTD